MSSLEQHSSNGEIHTSQDQLTSLKLSIEDTNNNTVDITTLGSGNNKIFKCKINTWMTFSDLKFELVKKIFRKPLQNNIHESIDGYYLELKKDFLFPGSPQRIPENGGIKDKELLLEGLTNKLYNKLRPVNSKGQLIQKDGEVIGNNTPSGLDDASSFLHGDMVFLAIRPYT